MNDEAADAETPGSTDMVERRTDFHGPCPISRPKPNSRCGRIAVLLLAASAALPGCAYHAGTASLFAPDLHFVYVPVFQSNSYRRGLGERLTEAVKKEIEERSTLKLVNSPEDADCQLVCKIMNDSKTVLMESFTDEVREASIGLNVEVKFLDRTGQPFAAAPDAYTVPVPAAAATTIPTGVANTMQTASLYTELGQSGMVAQQQAIELLARQIVGLMEEPW